LSGIHDDFGHRFIAEDASPVIHALLDGSNDDANVIDNHRPRLGTRAILP